MKLIVTTLILLYISISLFGQVMLRGHIHQPDETQPLVVNIPFIFGYAHEIDRPLAIDKAGTFSTKILLDEEKICYLHWGDHKALLWMRPGVDLTVDLDGATGQITFGGPMADANTLLEELKLKDAPSFLVSDQRVTAAEMQDRVIEPYEKHLAASKQKIEASPLTASEKEFLKAELHDHFVANIDWYVRTARWPREEWSDFILEFFQGETTEPQSVLHGPMYYGFVDAYVRFLATRAFSNRDNPDRFAQSLDSTYGISSFDSLMAIAREHSETALDWMAVERAFDRNTAERYLAQRIKEKYDAGEVSTGNYLLEALETYQPNGPYLDTLTGIRGRLLAKMATPNHEIVIPEDYRTFQGIQAFVKQFQGKVVYLDIWGTWCGPCKEEMQYLPPLKKHFEGKDVVFLYLDMDDDYKDDQWREYIQANAITGVHLRKNNEDILPIWQELLPDNPSRHGHYPTYFIVDRQGDLVTEGVKRPSDGKNLITQLEQYLNQ